MLTWLAPAAASRIMALMRVQSLALTGRVRVLVDRVEKALSILMPRARRFGAYPLIRGFCLLFLVKLWHALHNGQARGYS